MEEQEKVPGFTEMAKELGQEMAQISQDWHILQDQAKKDYLDSHKTEILDSDMTAFPKPRKGCPKCFGRGFEGVIDQGAGRDINICRCIRNRMGRKDVEFLTYGEFRKMLDHCGRVFNLGGNNEKVVAKDIQGTDKVDSDQGNEEQQGASSIQG